MKLILFLALVTLGADEGTDLGSTKYKVSPDQPLGWRGDGSGRFPGATPPLTWERARQGNGYAVRNLIWATPLPPVGISSPIVVGNRVFLTAGFTDLMCLDKATGRILWLRSHPEVEALTAEERKADPAYAAKVDPLLPKLLQANAEVVEALNAQAGTALTSAGRVPEAINKKKAIEKEMHDLLMAIDRKKFGLNWAQAIYGYCTETPASDGKHVCALFATGVSACYDLDGNRKWIARGAIGGEEKGHYSSPAIAGRQFVVWGDPEIRAYDIETGRVVWTNPAKGSNCGSVVRLRAGGEWVAGVQTSCFVRLRDGHPIWKGGELNYQFTTSIIEGDTIYAWSPGGNKDFKAWKTPAGEGGQVQPKLTFKKPDWAADELAGKFEKGDLNASPLYVDGLIYNLYCGGGLVVHDAATGEVVYRKVLPMKPRTEYWAWGGASASPALAGKRIYLMDNQGTTVVIAPGRQYKELAVNRIAEVDGQGQNQVQNLASPFFEGPRLYYRTAGHLYCIGER